MDNANIRALPSQFRILSSGPGMTPASLNAPFLISTTLRNTSHLCWSLCQHRYCQRLPRNPFSFLGFPPFFPPSRPFSPLVPVSLSLPFSLSSFPFIFLSQSFSHTVTCSLTLRIFPTCLLFVSLSLFALSRYCSEFLPSSSPLLSSLFLSLSPSLLPIPPPPPSHHPACSQSPCVNCHKPVRGTLQLHWSDWCKS